MDKASLLYYKESTDGQILEEGISEAGSISSFIAAGTSYSNYNINQSDDVGRSMSNRYQSGDTPDGILTPIHRDNKSISYSHHKPSHCIIENTFDH